MTLTPEIDLASMVDALPLSALELVGAFKVSSNRIRIRMPSGVTAECLRTEAAALVTAVIAQWMNDQQQAALERRQRLERQQAEAAAAAVEVIVPPNAETESVPA